MFSLENVRVFEKFRGNTLSIKRSFLNKIVPSTEPRFAQRAEAWRLGGMVDGAMVYGSLMRGGDVGRGAALLRGAVRNGEVC
jgi:hypothetical protein